MNNPALRPDLLMILLLSLLALFLYTSSRIRQKYRPRPPKMLPISRRQIEVIVYRKRMLWHILPCILIILLMACIYLAGRMDFPAAIISAIIILVIPAWSLYVLSFLQWRPLRTIPAELWAELDQTLRGEQLQRMDGAWQFINRDWFIRVNEECCIVLCAKYIDFSIPVRYRLNTMRSIGVKASGIRIHSHELIFTTKNHSILRTRSQQTPHITSWVKNHGGRFE